jgi:hypothetical protein
MVNKTRTRNRRRNRSGGGWFDFGGIFSSKPKQSTTYQPQPTTYQPQPTTYQPTTYQPQPTTLQSQPTRYGGKKYTLKRKMRGGFEPNNTSSNLAFYASPYNGVNTAEPKNIVGGKKRRTKHSRRYSRRY